MSAALQHAPGLNGTAPTPPVLQIAGLSKTFGATRALIDASLDIKPGEIHALVGQNGSGKSTLIKTLAGYHTPDSGSVAELDGAPFDLGHTVPDGLRFVHQDLGLVLELNAMDNLALHGGFARGALGRVHWSEQEQETRRVLARFGVDLDIHRPLAAATPVERTVVAIAAALQGWQGGHAACSCSTSRPPSCRTTRSSACSRWSGRSGARARACSTSRTASTRSSSSRTA